MASLPLTLLGLALATAPARAADDTQTLLYDLRLGSRHVGTREVVVRYLPAKDGREVRLIESYTELQAEVAGRSYRFSNRASARIEPVKSSFTSYVDEDGQVREVQARQRSDGTWKVSVIEDGELKQADLLRGQADLSSLQLLDPVAHRELTTRSRASVLAAETGTVLSGPVEDLGEGTLSLGSDTVAVQRYAWTPAAGRVELSWSMDGLLVGYDSVLLGQTLQARLREAPAARAYGEIESMAPVIDDVSEQEL